MTDSANNAALEQGSYDLIKRRLSNSGAQLRTDIDSLNKNRIDTFGSTEIKVKGRARVRTEHNCIPRDIVLIGDKLIFAYNVFLGMKKNTQVGDVFSVQKLVQQDDHYEVEAYPNETKFLTDKRFLRDFDELYTYYKETCLQHLFQQNGKLFALFKIGDKLTDVRVFRWEIAADNTLDYIDNRGERDLNTDQDYDFEWVKTDRSDHEEGRHPHINILDTVFVETVGGDLTIKIENNTESGEGIYAEPVDDKNQSLADCEVEYAKLGEIILLKVLPYREKVWRYYIFNCVTEKVIRQDAISDACVQLPDDHGIIFPGGYYLQSGQTRSFEDHIENLEFHKQIKSPNGEDVLYVFYEPSEGRYALFAYNLIEKNLQNPIYCHGYGVYEDGLTITFKAEKEEAERVHPIQVWDSPFCSVEFAANAPTPSSMLGKIGNPDLVRGISDLYSVCKAISEQNPNVSHYESLISLTRSILDRYHWLTEPDFAPLNTQLHEIFETSEQVLDEFEKVSQIQETAKKALADIEQEYKATTKDIRPDSFKLATEFVTGLEALKLLKGKIISLEEVKYIDVTALQALQTRLDELTLELSKSTAQFLQKEAALAPYHDKLAELTSLSEKSESVTELNGFLDELDALGDELDLLNHTMLDLEIDDSRVRTQILEDVSGVYGLVNRAKASIEIRRKSLGSVEAKAEFAARFKLFSQSITSSLNNARTPEQCDEQLSRLLIQLEELESQFSEYDEYLAEIMAKRDDVYESFEAHKQQLIDERQRRALNLANAAERILQGVTRRSQNFTDIDEINSYFASDPMISKLRSLTQELKELGDEIKADDIQAKLKAAKDQGIRSLRDKQDIYSDGGNSVKIGKHHFGVNKQQLDLTLLPRDEDLMFHLTGTEYFEPIGDKSIRETLLAYRPYWQQNLVSENNDIYRGEFLAAQVLTAATDPTHVLTLDELNAAIGEDTLLTLVQKFAEPRYQEGYEKGIHDHDATLILQNLLAQKQALGLLIYPTSARVVAQLYASQCDDKQLIKWREQSIQAELMETLLGDARFKVQLATELGEVITQFAQNELNRYLGYTSTLSGQLSAEYLIKELAQSKKELVFSTSHTVKKLAEQFNSVARSKGFAGSLQDTLQTLEHLQDKAIMVTSWLNAYGQQHDTEVSSDNLIEAANMVLLQHLKMVKFTAQDVAVSNQVNGLLGQHIRIEEQALTLDYSEFFARTELYLAEHARGFSHYHELKSDILVEQKERLQLDEFKPRPLSSFVRNQLIDKVYFPIIGDNLAKQIGASGNNKRTDLMGMLLLISPPGYGKTTLIEYVANRLGLTFVKVNCPSIGHDQVSLDPGQAINATAAKEIEKINQSFEMGNNVMLYLDDIQHTNPEFLQKFISLCDGSRRIDGVWNGRSKTYDLRGKKFAVVMAGNPYTESGESFKIPDMLANRADIYNLGDTLSGCEQEFAMSFIENALTSNAVLAPLANRNMQDLYKLVRIAQGEDISLNELEHNYSQAQANEIVSVLEKLIQIRNTVLKVNAQYIASAAQDDDYRIEPPFKLQGSYRNMNKMAEKVVAAMNDEELENLIQDHYRGEAQTLSKGSEENLLKLAELRGTLDELASSRWQQILDDYALLNRANDAGSPVLLAVEQLGELNESLTSIATKLDKEQLSHNYSALFESLNQAISAQDTNGSIQSVAKVIEQSAQQSPLSASFEQLLELLTEQHQQNQVHSEQLAHQGANTTGTLVSKVNDALVQLTGALNTQSQRSSEQAQLDAQRADNKLASQHALTEALSEQLQQVTSAIERQRDSQISSAEQSASKHSEVMANQSAELAKLAGELAKVRSAFSAQNVLKESQVEQSKELQQALVECVSSKLEHMANVLEAQSLVSDHQRQTELLLQQSDALKVIAEKTDIADALSGLSRDFLQSQNTLGAALKEALELSQQQTAEQLLSVSGSMQQNHDDLSTQTLVHSSVLEQLVAQLREQVESAQQATPSDEVALALSELVNTTLPSLMQQAEQSNTLDPELGRKVDVILERLARIERLPAQTQGAAQSSENPYML
ncbi:DNA repair ATPase [Pseudoalteromonas umbrosa]|uniref:DNA repair ATPase n=1 Tax=Pseudoalteromonas umbrosa TaxID=3048489 RepID=UPI0024C23039|nr:DNA repair ATPase [Pseudoalteromonas sp. B95]MDK1288422.1 DNA repair ATPase [Pseudoalteromonas sp. B95]